MEEFTKMLRVIYTLIPEGTDIAELLNSIESYNVTKRTQLKNQLINILNDIP